MIPAQVSYFNYVDISIIVIMFLFVLFGYVRGLVKEICSLFSWTFTSIAAMYTCRYVADLFKELIKVDVIRSVVGYVISFVVILMLLLMITSIISEKVAQSKFCNVDKAIGGMFGIIKSFIIILFIVCIAVIFAPKSALITGIDNSKIGPYVKDIAIDVCNDLKTFLKSQEFKAMYEHMNNNLTTPKKTNAAADVKQLAIPKISKIVYEKKDKEVIQKMRDDYLRKNAAIGPNNEKKHAIVSINKRQDKKT